MWHEYEVLQILHATQKNNNLTMIHNTAMYLMIQWPRFYLVINAVYFYVMKQGFVAVGVLRST